MLNSLACVISNLYLVSINKLKYSVKTFFVFITLNCLLQVLSFNSYANDTLNQLRNNLAGQDMLANLRVQNAIELKQLDADLVGDRFDPASGSISFYRSIIDIPGNSKLRVSLGQVLRNRNGWVDDVPQIRTRVFAFMGFNDTRDGVYWGRNRCSGSPQMETIAFGGLYYYWKQTYSGGSYVNKPSTVYISPKAHASPLMMLTPGGKLQTLFNRDQHATTNDEFSINNETVQYTTKDNWKITCINDIGNDQGEGFIAETPEGLKYYFDKLHYKPYQAGVGENKYITMSSLFNQNESYSYTNNMYFYNASMMASRVEDQFGNWVRYEYDDYGQIKKIYSNDDRQITAEHGYNDYKPYISVDGNTLENYGDKVLGLNY